MSAARKVTFTFVTGNKKKLEVCGVARSHAQEVQAILSSSFPFPVDRRDVDLPELQGKPEMIALEKCRLAAQQVCCILGVACVGVVHGSR